MMFTIGCANAYPIDINYNDGIYHIVLKGEKIKKHIKFISSDSLITNKEAHQRAKSEFTINTGYFDPNNGKSISYIVSDRNTVEDPLLNDSLLSNPVLRRNLSKIIDRTDKPVIKSKDKRYRSS